MKKYLFILLLIVIPAYIVGQTPHRDHIDDRDAGVEAYSYTNDSIVTLDPDAWRPDALKSVWLGALVPGLGQIYNRSYWKLPIVYGGFMGCIYAISWNSEKYSVSKEAYRDLYIDKANGEVSNDLTKSYNQILTNGYTIEKMGGVDTYLQTLNGKQNTYRRYRDISIVCTILVYGLSLIDAYVDAQLFDFDISSDLSINVQPALYTDPYHMNQRSTELKVAVNF